MTAASILLVTGLLSYFIFAASLAETPLSASLIAIAIWFSGRLVSGLSPGGDPYREATKKELKAAERKAGKAEKAAAAKKK